MFFVVFFNLVGVVLLDVIVIGIISDDEILVCGKFSFDFVMMEVLFVWQDCDSGEWSMQVIGGGNSRGVIYLGWVEIDQQLINLFEYFFESFDMLEFNVVVICF